jgi:hypothetical protein
MNKRKTLIIRLNKTTHKPEYIGIETPTENDYSILKTIYGNPKAIITPIPDEEKKTQ